MDNGNITPEFKEKAKGKTPEEIVALAQEEGVELSDEQLEAVSGGWTGSDCPNCGSDNTGWDIFEGFENFCGDCGYRW